MERALRSNAEASRCEGAASPTPSCALQTLLQTIGPMLAAPPDIQVMREV
jgi:hypothetical protein